ncbi:MULTISPECIES: alpha/beta fold hydrolase [Hydrocarboniphaga]|jgi:predicted alpha/beta hydrolase|uniref:alpha/beta hydrolase family protein n=1 Tax=Hydrocarboniphaga TaxID=243627 RepID=UPI002ABC6626|nr:alpha/beta fold hydrolase [Hydrocarboniphaga sp.]MDZ4078423.1 alpha/beta fold hydrolase [Hydrocarboniphaga sp.]
MTGSKIITITCADGVLLGGHLWRNRADRTHGTVIVNAATGVLASYYHRYARFLANQGFDVLTYDYRGIGASRPATLRGCRYRWSDWGILDFDAAIEFARRHAGGRPLLVAGHSIGGFLPGFAENARWITRTLTVGAQYAWWRDYAAGSKARLVWKWHVVMPLLTALCGYFPGRRLGWIEDLPAGVANEWSFRRERMELSHPAADRDAILKRFAAVTAPILAITVGDDELAPPAAVRRGLSYYPNAPANQVLLTPARLGAEKIGHFGLFHARHPDSFWRDTIAWLRDGINPWSERVEGAGPVFAEIER